MPGFYILLVIALVAIWFLGAFLFKPLGGFFGKIGKDAIDIIKEEDKEEKTE